MKKLTTLLIALLSIAALSASALPPPEKDGVRLNKLKEQLSSFDGKVVEVEFSCAISLKEDGPGQWTVLCKVWTRNGSVHYPSNVRVSFSGKDAKKYFDDLLEEPEDPYNDAATESIYLLVDGKTCRAVGKRFKKSKGIYTW